MSDDTTIRVLREIEDLKRRIARLERKEDGERIVARYTRATAQTISVNTITQVDFNVLVYDTHSAVTTGAGWIFTAPMAGYYDWTSAVRLASTTDWAFSEEARLFLRINGVDFAALDYMNDRQSPAIAIYTFLHGSATAHMASGDTGYITVYQEGLAPSLDTVASALYTFVEIERRNM